MLEGVQVFAQATRSPALPMALLAAHSLECALKAFVSRGGDDRAVMDPKIRHNLEALWAMAHGEGLAIPNSPPHWVSNLSHLHNSPYYLRYSTGVNGVVSPSPEPMTSELAALVGLVATSL